MRSLTIGLKLLSLGQKGAEAKRLVLSRYARPGLFVKQIDFAILVLSFFYSALL
jgi:hypothetical protein